ncbi:MAG: hypothetical protein JWN98_1336 [Abditibacteriota bacterium]|nr:hypothetical protein [Abditibacteriota bacterium]
MIDTVIDNWFPGVLDWALAAASMFNTILLVWLGLTVLLNAEKRTWGIWLAGCGLVLGGVFFAGHTATLDYRLEDLLHEISNWWYPAWLCVLLLPYGWYVLMLWYAGFWDAPFRASAHTELHRRQRRWFVCTTLFALALIAVLTAVNPFRVLKQVAYLDNSTSLAGLPFLVMLYPLYILQCLVLSLDALLRPGPTGRMMGDLARRRARPWLIASSLVQLLVSLLMAQVLVWVVREVFESRLNNVVNAMIALIDLFDLATTTLIAIAVVLMGKAIVSYEIFTGKTLPRRGFLRQWRNIVTLAAIYSVLVALAWALPLRPVYPLLVTTLLLAISFALFSWRSYAEREDYLDHLRPFVASQNLYGHLLARDNTQSTLTPPDANQSPLAATSLPASTSTAHSETMLPEVDARPQFSALCEGMLNASVAYLVPLGTLAPLAGAPLSFPRTEIPSLPSLHEITVQFHSPQQMCVLVDPERWSGATWAISLWSERGLIGVLLLGEKRDGSLYAQEEIEIARASGERLIDTQAGAAMAQRLMSLQRQRLAESQVIDRRARRVLHDDILPRLHTAMISINALGHTDDAATSAVNQLAEVHREISNLLHEMPLSTTPEFARRGLIGALQDTVEHDFPGAFDAVEWQIEDSAENYARQLSPLSAEVLFYAAREAIRNAARYGRPGTATAMATSQTGGTAHTHRTEEQDATAHSFTLLITALWRDGIWQLGIEDNGIGIGTVSSAGSNSQGGSGQGLALHSTLLAVVGGQLSVESVPHQFTRVTLTLQHAIARHTSTLRTQPSRNQPAEAASREYDELDSVLQKTNGLTTTSTAS